MHHRGGLWGLRVKRLVLEIADRCNLACQHCFASRHRGKGLLQHSLYRRILAEAKPWGFGELAFTGAANQRCTWPSTGLCEKPRIEAIATAS